MDVTEHPWGRESTPYAAAGGAAGVRALVECFYDRIDASAPTLRGMLPADDLVSRQKLYEFFSGWLGGPQLYIEKRGHPRLRLRHMPFPIGDAEAAEWLRCMGEAMDESGIDGPLRGFLEEQFTASALHLRNR
jgi:hemoglobin